MKQTFEELREKFFSPENRAKTIFVSIIVLAAWIIVALFAYAFGGANALVPAILLPAALCFFVGNQAVNTAVRRETQLYCDEEGIVYDIVQNRKSDIAFWAIVGVVGCIVIAVILSFFNQFLAIIPLLPILMAFAFVVNFVISLSRTRTMREDMARRDARNPNSGKKRR